jgi:alginate O-acetyltransferase complex protein AlgJ
MATEPVFDVNHLDPFPAQYEKYYNDTFTVRSLMIRYYNFINIVLFKKSPVPDQVIIGNNGWLFMAGTEKDAYTGKNPLTALELNTIKTELEYRKKYLNERGCKFYFLIAPTKANIYSENLPPTIFKFNSLSWAEQLIGYLNQHGDVKPLDVLNVLRKNKDIYPVYYKLDNHWTEFGAFFAVNEFLHTLQTDFPQTTLLQLEKYTTTKIEKNTGNLSGMLSNIDIFNDFSYQLKPANGFRAQTAPNVGYPCVPGFPYCWEYEKVKEISNSHLPKILIISDSFGEAFFPFAAENFSRTVKIFDAWQYKLNEDIVNKEKPDIVLLIMLESSIKGLLKFPKRNI